MPDEQSSIVLYYSAGLRNKNAPMVNPSPPFFLFMRVDTWTPFRFLWRTRACMLKRKSGWPEDGNWRIKEWTLAKASAVL